MYNLEISNRLYSFVIALNVQYTNVKTNTRFAILKLRKGFLSSAESVLWKHVAMMIIGKYDAITT